MGHLKYKLLRSAGPKEVFHRADAHCSSQWVPQGVTTPHLLPAHPSGEKTPQFGQTGLVVTNSLYPVACRLRIGEGAGCFGSGFIPLCSPQCSRTAAAAPRSSYDQLNA